MCLADTVSLTVIGITCSHEEGDTSVGCMTLGAWGVDGDSCMQVDANYMAATGSNAAAITSYASA